jgi:hypothetical protein
MSISHPRLTTFNLEAKLTASKFLAVWVGMVHYISTSERLNERRNK